MSIPSVGSGNVEVTILGEEYTLVPTLRAAKAISAKYGGGMTAVNRISQMDIDVIIDIVASGLSLTPNGIKKFANEVGLEESIFQTGLFEISGPCVKYVHVLMNGGKPVGEDAYKDDAPLKANG